MRVIVDFELCEAHGECVNVAPEIFELDDDAEAVTLLQEEPDEELRAKAKSAVSACPVMAIKLAD